MEKKIILAGTPKAIENVVRENRNREKRGEISFLEPSPLEQDLGGLGTAQDDREAELNARETALNAREAELVEREIILKNSGVDMAVEESMTIENNPTKRANNK